MPKKTRPVKPKKTKSHKKTVGYFLKVYFFSVFAGVIVFTAGNFFLQPQVQCANSATCVSDLSEKIENNAVGIFEGSKVVPPKIDLAFDNLKPSVLGADTASGKKHIYIDLASQTLYAFQGNTQVMKTFISSGRWKKTPVGNFRIWEKLRSTRMAGGEGQDAYDLPNVPYVMYFYNDFGLHGAYWHDNFGHTMSHGCVNMRPVDARDLFSWTDAPGKGQKGTAVSVCNSFSRGKCVQENPIN